MRDSHPEPGLPQPYRQLGVVLLGAADGREFRCSAGRIALKEESTSGDSETPFPCAQLLAQ